MLCKTISVMGKRVALSIALSGLLCSAQAQNARRAEDFWPMTAGNTWTLASKIQNRNSPPQIVTVARVMPQSGGAVAEIRYEVSGKLVQIETYRITPKTIFRLTSGAAGGGKIEPPLPVIQFPLTAGRKWTWKGTVTLAGVRTQARAAFTVSGPEAVKAPAGTYRAMKVFSALVVNINGLDTKIPNAYWFAPGVGVVQQLVRLGNTEIRSVLTRYTRKTKPSEAPPSSRAGKRKRT